jgi:hypothetical protein
VRGLQWWNSGSWDEIGSADTVVWTSQRALRRARMVRCAKIAVAVVMAAALGAILVLAAVRRGFAPEREAGIQVGACRPARSFVPPL